MVIAFLNTSRLRSLFFRGAGLIAVFCFLWGCSRPAPNQVQGYVEGEFVYVASPSAGALDTLYVQRGARVKKGDLLFTLDSSPEREARDEAARLAAQARANLEDARKGKRPTEIEALEAELGQARDALALSEKEFARQEKLMRVPGGTAEQDLERARSARDQDRQRAARIEADLKTARLGARTDQIAAAAEYLKAREAVLANAEWKLLQKRQASPQDALVFDTLYRKGEWVAAGRPVVVLLPPQGVKVRAFVPETLAGTIHPGDPARVIVDGVRAPLSGKVSFISPQAEYTPPVIYSRESRSKLVFMVEVTFDHETAAGLHPGQPVDVQFGPLQ